MYLRQRMLIGSFTDLAHVDGHPPKASETTEDNAGGNDAGNENSDVPSERGSEDNAGAENLDVFSEHGSGDGPPFQQYEEAQEYQDLIEDVTDQRLKSAAGRTEKEKPVSCFRESFAVRVETRHVSISQLSKRT